MASTRSGNTTGIYCITNIVSHKKYIGQSVNIERRWHEHIVSLSGNRHHSSHLQRSWNHYGEQGFSFSILEECDEDLLTTREDYWITLMNTTDRAFGYNMREAGPSGKWSDESRERLSEAQKGLFTGQKNPSAKITESQAIDVIQMLLNGKSMKSIMKNTGIPYKTIYHIKRKDTWTHLTESVEFPCSFSSKYRGISYDKVYRKWCARMNKDKQTVYLEFFDTELEAAIARDKKAVEFYGDKAILNNITQDPERLT